ncbi:hypothetical protein PMIN03_002261 [Paraphaeosphaeria minitans]
MSEANTTYTNKLILAPAYNARSPTAKMAKLSESQSASLPSRKSNRPGKLELSTSQVLLLTFTLLTLPLLLQALYNTYLTPHLPPLHAPQNDSNTSLDPSSPSLLPACRAHTYTTQIVSLDPLMIYINNFTSSAEAEALIKLGADDFEDSFISRPSGGTQKASGRTSQSAPLAIEEPLVECIVARARAFLGTMLHAHERFSTYVHHPTLAPSLLEKTTTRLTFSASYLVPSSYATSRPSVTTCTRTSGPATSASPMGVGGCSTGRRASSFF